MPKYKSLQEKVLNIQEKDFDALALEVFEYQYTHNSTYRKFVDYRKVKPGNIKSLNEIPFLPISFFKTQRVSTETWKEETLFESSGTTGQDSSKHFVRSTDFYKNLSVQIFEQMYGSLNQYHILALLPSYLEKGNSSLVYMVDEFIKKSGSEQAGFYLHNHQELIDKIKYLQDNSEKRIILWGVSYALLDLADAYSIDLSGHIVMETGGMKGRRREMIREELHAVLSKAFQSKYIHSEYGMTELFAQAYSKGLGIFDLPAQMKVMIRDINDPLEIYSRCNKRGGINVIDLGNIHSCAFIETQDLGFLNDKSQLQILGRFDNSDIRGCNLLI